MADPFRKMDSTSTYSPKSSPHGGRSPVVSRQDSSGTLKTTISLGKTPTIIHTGPFYLMKEPPEKAELTGDKDLMTEYGLHNALTKFKDKKVKEPLNTFLPNLPTINDSPYDLENSTLRSIIEKPPILGKEIVTLTSVQLAGFRLHPGPLPEKYRHLNVTGVTRKIKNKQKKAKHQKDGGVVSDPVSTDSIGAEPYEKKHKKQKRHEDDKERKKRKKEKKRKKKSHSPEPAVTSGNTNSGAISLNNIPFGLSANIAGSSVGGSMSNSLSSLTATLGGSVLAPNIPINTPTLPSQQSSLTPSSLLISNNCPPEAQVSSGFGAMLNVASASGSSSGGVANNSNNTGASNFLITAFSSGLSSTNSSSNTVGAQGSSGFPQNSSGGLLMPQQQSHY